MIKRLILVTLVNTFILAGCQFEYESSPDFSTKQPFEMKDFVISETFFPDDIMLVGLGDSLTQGVGDERKLGGYLGRLASEMKTFQGIREVDLKNEAKRGRRSDQLLKQLKSGDINEPIKEADVILVTIGGNDIMRIVKQDLFQLRIAAFQKELVAFSERYSEILMEIRKTNPNSPIIMVGLYNPFTVVTNEKNEFDEIMLNWNEAILNTSYTDVNACFVPVSDLFNSNANMVYHTDFFHPNSKGYEQMTDRILESLESCGLKHLTKGEMDF